MLQKIKELQISQTARLIEIEGESEGSVAEFSGSGSTSQLVVSKKPSTSNKRKSGIFEKIKVCQIDTIAFSERLVTFTIPIGNSTQNSPKKPGNQSQIDCFGK